jgi:hypothetical protein
MERQTPPHGVPGLGPNASLHGRRPFPADNPWNQVIDDDPVDPNSARLIASIGANTGLHPDFGTTWEGKPNGIPYVVVAGPQTTVPVKFTAWPQESDPGPYPIPAHAPVEAGADAHVLVVDRDNWKLFELAVAKKRGNGWAAACGAKFDLNSNRLRPAGWTSADAAGLPIFPGLVRYDEVVEEQEIRHALRFTVSRSRRAYVAPARHFASRRTSPNLPPMGMRVRLRSSFETASFPPRVQVILRALKLYGMFVADNGSDWYISGAPDPRWNDDELRTLNRVRGRDFEVVQMGQVVTR